jgi:hypothetical protein
METLSRKTTSNKLVIDLRATSNFATEDMNLTMKGKLHEEIYLPDNMKLHASYNQNSLQSERSRCPTGTKDTPHEHK